MSKRNALADVYQIDLVQYGIRVWPLFGLNRLVEIRHRKRTGILFCSSGMCTSESLTFSESNACAAQYTIPNRTAIGVFSAPRLNVVNEAAAADLRRFEDHGAEVVFSFTPKPSKTFSFEVDGFKAFDASHRYVKHHVPRHSSIAKWELTLDVSAYLNAGYSIEDIRCEYESTSATDDVKSSAALGRARRLAGTETRPGLWHWQVKNVLGGIVRFGWEIASYGQSPAAEAVDLKKLAAELSVDPRVAKDLHNFVLICQYYVAGFRSLNKIGPAMITAKTALRRSIESLEKLIGAELISRTKGKGLIRITPAGEAVLDWWSQFYMRWTPIANFAAPVAATRKIGGRPR